MKFKFVFAFSRVSLPASIFEISRLFKLFELRAKKVILGLFDKSIESLFASNIFNTQTGIVNFNIRVRDEKGIWLDLIGTWC